MISPRPSGPWQPKQPSRKAVSRPRAAASSGGVSNQLTAL